MLNIKDKSIYWSIKITLVILGCVALFQIVPYFMELLRLLIDLFYISDKSIELKFMMICLSIWVTSKVMDTIVNIIFKIQKMLKKDFQNINNKTKE